MHGACNCFSVKGAAFWLITQITIFETWKHRVVFRWLMMAKICEKPPILERKNCLSSVSNCKCGCTKRVSRVCERLKRQRCSGNDQLVYKHHTVHAGRTIHRHPTAHMVLISSWIHTMVSYRKESIPTPPYSRWPCYPDNEHPPVSTSKHSGSRTSRHNSRPSNCPE